MTRNQVLTLAKKYHKKLFTDDPRFERNVFIQHIDGSLIFSARAFLMMKDDWVILMSENHGYHVYHCNDLVGYYHCEVPSNIPCYTLP